MRLERLWLTDFRLYEAAEISPAPNLTAVVGDNGQGKTSLLEATGWLATTHSFRGAPDAALVRVGTDRAIVRGEVERDGRARTIEAEVARVGRNRIQVNGHGVRKAKALEETLRATVFSPDDLDLVKGGPGGRRAYLDDLVAATSPLAAATLGEYERVVRQRSALLRSGTLTGLAVWDEQLVAKGAVVVRARLAVLERLHGPLAKAYADVAAGSGGVGDVSGAYEPPWADPAVTEGVTEPIEAALAAALARERRREVDRGMTLVGPHRDEWRLTVGGLDARTHASQGEQRSLALALRLAGHAVVTDAVGEAPVLLLDDVFSELDPGRTEALVAHLPSGQALVTTASVLPSDLSVDLVVRVAGGEVRAA